MPLTDTQIKNAKPSDKPVKLSDGGGMYLEISPAGGQVVAPKVSNSRDGLCIGNFKVAGKSLDADCDPDTRPAAKLASIGCSV